MFFKSNVDGFDRPISEYLPLTDWGRCYAAKDTKIKWCIPGIYRIFFICHLKTYFLITVHVMRFINDSHQNLRLDFTRIGASHEIDKLVSKFRNIVVIFPNNTITNLHIFSSIKVQ